MKPYKISLEPVIKVVNFSEFTKLIEPFADLCFTDGYVFGSVDDIKNGAGIDTSVPGGDSSYHAREIQETDLVALTPFGFQVHSENNNNTFLQFTFIKESPIGVNVDNIEKIASLQSENPLNMFVVDSEYGLVGSTAIFFKKKRNKIAVYLLNHFEDPEDVDMLIDLSCKINKKSESEIEIETVDLTETGYVGENVLKYFSPTKASWA